MKIALTVSDKHIAPLFSGVNLWILDTSFRNERKFIINTDTWQETDWKHRLMSEDIEALICSGIDNFISGSLSGCGIRVLDGVTGTPSGAIEEHINMLKGN